MKAFIQGYSLYAMSNANKLVEKIPRWRGAQISKLLYIPE
jgi:hypothetical protein